MALILNGKEVAAACKAELLQKIKTLSSHGQKVGLAVVLVGDDAASRIYMNRLLKNANDLGIAAHARQLPADITEAELISVIEELNKDDAIRGILPMMPLPAHLAADKITQAIAPEKDVDALNAINVGLVAAGKSRWAPCTPRAVMAILDYYNIELAGKHAVIIGRSNVVGKPLANLMLGRDATVTICHSKTRQLAEIVRQADVVVAAVGRAEMITADMIKPGAVVIDVGINEVAGKIVGDVAYTEVEKVASAITPVPGGVGSVSNMMVMQAVLRQ